MERMEGGWHKLFAWQLFVLGLKKPTRCSKELTEDQREKLRTSKRPA